MVTRRVLISLVVSITAAVHAAAPVLPAAEKYRSLIKIDAQHIEKKREAWQRIFRQQKIRQGISLALIGAGIGGLIYMFLKEPAAQPPAAPPSTVAQNQKDELQARALSLVVQDMERLRLTRTNFKERIRYNIEHGFDKAIYSFIGGLFVYYLAKSENLITEKIKEFAGFGQDALFHQLARAVLENFALLTQSMAAFLRTAHAAEKEAVPDLLFQQLAYGVTIDHIAFVHACEECMAFIEQTIGDSEDDQAQALKQAMDQIIQISNEFIAQHDTTYKAACDGSLNGQMSALLVFAQGLAAELIRFLKATGTFFYGKEFALQWHGHEKKTQQ